MDNKDIIKYLLKNYPKIEYSLNLNDLLEMELMDIVTYGGYTPPKNQVSQTIIRFNPFMAGLDLKYDFRKDELQIVYNKWDTHRSENDKILLSGKTIKDVLQRFIIYNLSGK